MYPGSPGLLTSKLMSSNSKTVPPCVTLLQARGGLAFILPAKVYCLHPSELAHQLMKGVIQ